MNSLTFRMVESGLTPKLAKSKVNAIGRNTVTAIGSYWHDNFREKHFTAAGGREYNYAPRNVRYMIQKAKKYGHRDPLVFTGKSRALSRLKDIRATAAAGAAKVRVVLHTPALNFIPRGGSISMRDEMTRTSLSEIHRLSEVGSAAHEQGYRQLTGSTTSTIQ